VLCDPADDLGGGLVLSRVECLRDLWVERRCERPGLRPVDGDLDEPQPIRVLTDPTLLAAGVDVAAGDPLLVGFPVHRAGSRNAIRSRGEPLRDAGPLAEVVVIGPRTVALDIGTGGLRCAVVELHAAMHADHRLHDVRRQPTDP